MEHPEEKPKITSGLPKTSPKGTGGLLKTSPLRGGPISNLELYAFGAVFALLYIASCIIPPSVLEEWELSILVFVGGPFLVWGARVILKTG